ncbi:MAG: insulinase family protein [Deferribacteraceae bacterium]|nr:insulinase family protein [Deferribacteraceae bacterium]
MSEAREFRLQNGLTVVHEYTPHTQVLSVQAWIKTGSVNEDAKNNGISHFLEHILFKGTANYAPDEIDAIVDAHGGRMNAGTSKDYTMYYITLPVEHAAVAADVIADMIFNATFDANEIEKEKPVVVQEIQRKFDNPTYDMWQDAAADLYAGTPYAMEIIGTEENVNSFTPKMLKDYYASHYHPKNTTLILTGDISEAEARKLAEAHFSQEAKVAAASGYSNKWKPADIKQEAKIYEKEVAQDYLLAAYRVPATAPDAPVYEVLTEILAGGEYSLLNQELKYSQGLVTAVSAGDMLSKNSGAYIFYLVTNPDDSEKALSELQKLLASFVKEGPSDQELEKAKNRLTSRTIFTKERASSLAQEIGYSYTLDIKDYYHTYNDRIRSITAADIRKIAKLFTTEALIYKTIPESPNR